MKVATPMISWHAREPVLSVDVHSSGKIATGGADKFVRVSLVCFPLPLVCTAVAVLSLSYLGCLFAYKYPCAVFFISKF